METTTSRILDGKAVARQVRDDVAQRVQALARHGVQPGLAVVLVGGDPASQVYVRNKDRAAQEAGFAMRTSLLPAEASREEVLACVAELNADAAIHGILVQLPLPKGLDEQEIIAAVEPAKDVDGLTLPSVAALWSGAEGLRPCTPAGCIELLDRSGIAIEGKRALIIGRSQLVGKPLAALLLARNATVTLAHSRTRDLPTVAREAEILVAAVGRPRLVRADWVRPGATVLDVGINRMDDGSLCGDVDFEGAVAVAGAITPVPGGIGPMTIAMLLANTVRAAARSCSVSYDELLPN